MGTLVTAGHASKTRLMPQSFLHADIRRFNGAATENFAGVWVRWKNLFKLAALSAADLQLRNPYCRLARAI